jgi:transposase-like protein
MRKAGIHPQGPTQLTLTLYAIALQGQLILLSVRWYLTYTLSYRQLERMLREQGWAVDHTSVFRWVQRYGPE